MTDKTGKCIRGVRQLLGCACRVESGFLQLSCKLSWLVRACLVARTKLQTLACTEPDEEDGNMTQSKVISADSHVMEPADFWETRLDQKYRDNAPRVVPKRNGKGYVFIAPEVNPFPVAGGFAAGRSGDELTDFMGKGYEAARPSGWDPAARLKDQDVDGVCAEVLFPTLGMPLFQLKDDELQRACFRVYNDWAAQFCSYNPKRLVGAALISLTDMTAAIARSKQNRLRYASRLALQTFGPSLARIRSYLDGDADLENVLLRNGRQLADLIFLQMMEHYDETPLGQDHYQIKVTRGFMLLQPQPLNVPPGQSARDFRQAVSPASQTPKQIFGGFGNVAIRFKSSTPTRSGDLPSLSMPTRPSKNGSNQARHNFRSNIARVRATSPISSSKPATRC